MKKQNLRIAAAIGGLLAISAVYVTDELRSTPVLNGGINMITAAAVDRAGATITATKQLSKP